MLMELLYINADDLDLDGRDEGAAGEEIQI